MGIKEIDEAFKAISDSTKTEGVEFMYPIRPDEMKSFLVRFADWQESNPHAKYSLNWDGNYLRVRIS